MGLAEKRAIKEFQENKLPQLHRAMNDAAGVELELDIDWDQMAAGETVAGSSRPPEQIEPLLTEIFFKPTTEALARLCADAMGREAIGESLKRVAFRCTGRRAEGQGKTFENGVLTIDQNYRNPGSDVRVDSIVRALEESL